MLGAIKEYVTSMGRWGWVVMVEIIGSSIGAFLDISGTVDIPMWGWLSLLLIGLIAAPFLSFRTLRLKRDNLQSEPDSIKDSRPIVSVSWQADILHGVFVNVKNDGAEGDFQAEIETVHTTESRMELDISWQRYNGYWDGEQSSVVTIMKGMTHRIRLVKFEQSSATPFGWLKIYRMSPSGMNSLDTHAYPVLAPKGILIPEVCLRITVSSSPSAKEGPKILTLRINGEGIVNEVS